MTDLNTDDSLDQSAAERTGRQKNLLPKPLLRLLLVFALVVILVVVIVVSATSGRGGGDAAAYQGYVTSISGMLEQSDAIGDQVTRLLTDPGDITRKEIQTRLDQSIATSQQLEEQAAALVVPKKLVEQHIHQFFVMVMQFRLRGLTDLKPSLMNALELQDVEVPSEQISRALSYLTNSDFLYKEVFLPKVTDLLAAEEVTGVSVPDTKFLADTDLASKSRVQEFLAVLKSTGSLQAVHGVAISKVVASPDDKQIAAGKTHNLSSSDELAFLVSVENQGNMAEKEVPVEVTLLSPDSTQPQTVTVTIPELKPKETLTVTVKGLNPTTYGEVATLKVVAGPVKDEKFKDNNTLEAKVIFTL
jgi:hypothetical protein